MADAGEDQVYNGGGTGTNKSGLVRFLAV